MYLRYLSRIQRFSRIVPIIVSKRQFSFREWASEKLGPAWMQFKIWGVHKFLNYLQRKQASPEVKCAMMSSDIIKKSKAFTNLFGTETSAHRNLYPTVLDESKFERYKLSDKPDVSMLKFEFFVLAGDSRPYIAQNVFELDKTKAYRPILITLLDATTRSLVMTVYDYNSPENETEEIVDVSFREKTK
jgi:hypothetical protein